MRTYDDMLHASDWDDDRFFRDPHDRAPGDRAPLPDAKVYPPGYFESCDTLRSRAYRVTGAVRLEICIKVRGPMFAVVGMLPGFKRVEGPAKEDRIDAWQAFIGMHEA